MEGVGSKMRDIDKISNERLKYLRKVKLRKIEILGVQIFLVILFIALWESLAQTGKIDSFITSQPSRILKTFMNLSSNDLLVHLKITCYQKSLLIYHLT